MILLALEYRKRAILIFVFNFFPNRMEKSEKQLLHERLDRAEKAMEEAKDEHTQAKEAFTEAWSEKNPNGSKAELLDYLDGKLTKYSEIYKKLVETYDDLVKKMSPIEPYNIESRKRIRMDSSIKSDYTNGSGMSQPAFRTRIVERDQKCVISGMDAKYCEACHIVPKRIFQKNGIPEKKLWDERFPHGCVVVEQRVMDVRNGILLSLPIHQAFDNYDLTIVKTNSLKFKVLTNPFANLSAEISNYNGNEIQFNPDKPNEWPSDVFLRFHNDCYETKKLILQAGGEHSEDSSQTLAELKGSASKVKLWLETGLSHTELENL